MAFGGNRSRRFNMNREEGGGNKDQEKGKDGTKSRSKMWRAILRKKEKEKRKETQLATD